MPRICFSTLNLGQLIEFLDDQDPTLVVPYGFGSGHLHRDYDDELAFEPKEDTTFGLMLASAKQEVGKRHYAYKGGIHMIDLETKVHIADYGQLGGDPITSLVLRYWKYTAE